MVLRASSRPMCVCVGLVVSARVFEDGLACDGRESEAEAKRSEVKTLFALGICYCLVA